MLLEIPPAATPTTPLTSPSVDSVDTQPTRMTTSSSRSKSDGPVKVISVPKGRLSEISTFHTKQKGSVEFEFAEVEVWPEFDTLVQKNLARIRFLNEKSWELAADSQFVARVGLALSAVLEKNSIQAKFVTVPPPGQIGTSSISVTLNNSIRPVFFGIHKQKSELLRLSDDKLVTKVLLDRSAPNGYAEKELANAVREATNMLLVNDIRMCYLSTMGCTRFFRIVDSEHNGLSLQVSPAISGEKFVPTLLGLTLEAYFGMPYIGYHKGLELTAITRPDPPVHGASTAAPGRVRWWVVNKLNSLRYFVYFNSSVAGCYYFKPTYGMYIGTLYEASQPAVQQAVIFKVAGDDATAVQRLENEASMYEMLDSKNLDIIPQRVVYGTLLGKFHVLALRPFGRPVTRQDLSLRTMERMRYALQTLHAYHIRHRDICLESFYIDHDDTVRIANLGTAQKCKSLPDVAREAEMKQLELLFK